MIPFINIASVLVARGHHVRLGTHECFREKIATKVGIDFYPISGKLEEWSEFMKETYTSTSFDTIRNFPARLDFYCALLVDMMTSCWAAYTSSSGIRYNALISNPVVFASSSIAEKTGIPYQCMFIMPIARTKGFPHPSLNATLKGGWSKQNALSFDLVDGFISWTMRSLINTFRVQTLGLRPVPATELWGLFSVNGYPFTALCTPSLHPKPKDWPRNCEIAGACTLTTDVLSESLRTAFRNMADASPTPLFYIGFGSVALCLRDFKKVLQLLSATLSSSNVRFIYHLKLKELHQIQEFVDLLSKKHSVYCIKREEDICKAGSARLIILTFSVAHELLFPVCAGTIHHGGAGSTHTSLYFGKGNF